MNPTLRHVLAVLVGAVVCVILNGPLLGLMMKVILPPAGFYPNTPSSYSLLEAIHYLSPFVAHAVPSLIGGPLAALVAASHRMTCALVAGGLHLCGVPAGRKRALCAGGEAMSGTPGLGTLPRPSGRQLLALAFTASHLCVCAQAKGANPGQDVFIDDHGHHRVQIRFAPFRFTLTDMRRDRVLLQSKGAITLTHRHGTDMTYREPYTLFQQGEMVSEIQLDRITGSVRTDSTATFFLGHAGSPQVASMVYSSHADGRIELTIQELRPPPSNGDSICQVAVRFASDSADTYLGMGMRFNTAEHRGTIVTNCAGGGPEPA